MTILEIAASLESWFWAPFEAGQALWSQIPDFARTALSAGLGVIFGAWITSRAQTKRAIVAELHALRTAQALSFSIASKGLAVKRQQIKPLKENFDQAIAM